MQSLTRRFREAHRTLDDAGTDRLLADLDDYRTLKDGALMQYADLHSPLPLTDCLLTSPRFADATPVDVTPIDCTPVEVEYVREPWPVWCKVALLIAGYAALFGAAVLLAWASNGGWRK